MTKSELKNLRIALVFISPFLIGFSFFVAYPLFASLYYGFTKYSIFRSPVWAGLYNYKKLFMEDTLFFVSLYNTLYYTVFIIPLKLCLALILALLLNSKVKGLAGYRAIFFLPSILPLAATSIVWLWILNPNFGIVSYFLEIFGLYGPGWFSEPAWSKPGLIIMSTWTLGPTMIIFLGGLQGIPNTLYEAARLDGANSLSQIRHITVPLLTPFIFFNAIINLISAFQYFIPAYMVTRGGPANSTLFYVLYLYRNAFLYFKMGYASAIAWILFLIIFGCTVIIVWSSKKWVYYEG